MFMRADDVTEAAVADSAEVPQDFAGLEEAGVESEVSREKNVTINVVECNLWMANGDEPLWVVCEEFQSIRWDCESLEGITW